MEEESDAAALLGHEDLAPSDEERVREEHQCYWRAWQMLRYDRQYGAMGGEHPISFATVDLYARRYGIEGLAFETLHTLLREMDFEYLAFVAEKMRAEAAAHNSSQP